MMITVIKLKMIAAFIKLFRDTAAVRIFRERDRALIDCDELQFGNLLLFFVPVVSDSQYKVKSFSNKKENVRKEKL